MSNSTAFDERVRNEAYRLWEEAGRPHGRDADFWHQASALVDSTPPVPAKAAAAPSKSRKKAVEPAAVEAPPRRRTRKAGTQPNTPSA